MDIARLRTARRAFRAAVLLVCGVCGWGRGAGAQTAPPVLTSEHGANSAETLKKHYVILVSLDGFRYDYANKYHAENLLALAKTGASAPSGMIPAYPSLTFPNHYTLATGLYPEHHGIVANSFYDAEKKQTYSLGNPATVTDGSWYGGTPIWILAEQQGMRSACFFWPGSEAEIQGTRPSYYLKYDEKVANDARVAQVLSWLRLPEAQRPHLITLYFSEVDHQGHEHGPDSAEVAAAVQVVDNEIGALEAGLKTLSLPVDVIVVSDHGMASVQGDWITLDQYFSDGQAFEKIVSGNLYAKSEADAQRAYEALHGKSDKFEAYRRKQMPPRLHDDSNPRSGDPIIVTTGPYLVRFSAPPAPGVAEHKQIGAHGFDPVRVPDMKASFFAAGPDIRTGVTVRTFENVDIYPLVAGLLGLDIAHLKTGPIDGELGPLQAILESRSPGGEK
ncbi:MAG: ectonucleotide pyrophosphatase/phosphodiesterase [Candidatus Acidiferrum sp.]|jgi:alkaline phosphatase D